jgi:peptide/nickel transport system ATP-binding protein
MTPLVEVRGLKKHFETSAGVIHAVDGVSFAIEKGKTLGVVGESGCGKSTLGRVVLRLLNSTEGQIFYEGNEITHARGHALKKLRSQMQIIFQDPGSSVNPRMTVGETIAEPLFIRGGMHKKDIRKHVLSLLSRVGLAERTVNLYPHELDGGRLQRVGIARALSLDPTFIVCDEPVSSLDVSIQAQILNLMKDLQAEMGLTYLFISHDLSVVKHISDSIMVMYLGSAVEFCPAKELFERPLHPYTQALLSAIPVPSLRHIRQPILLKGEIAAPIDLSPECRFLKRCLYAKAECGDSVPSLIEIERGHYVACRLAPLSN